jgi:hypothetical protein
MMPRLRREFILLRGASKNPLPEFVMIPTHFQMNTSPTDYNPGEPLDGLLRKGIDSGLGRIHANEPLLPMLIVAKGEQYDVKIFTDMNINEAYSDAQRHLRDADPVVNAYAFIYEATLQAEGWNHELKVVAVEGGQRDAAHGFRLIGVPKDENSGSAALYEGHAPQLLPSAEPRVAPNDVRGIAAGAAARKSWWRFW